jgi:hypothetical protein
MRAVDDMRVLSIRLPKELDNRLHREAHRLQTTRSELAREVITQYLKRLAEGEENVADGVPGIRPEASPPLDTPPTPALEVQAPARGRRPRDTGKQ